MFAFFYSTIGLFLSSLFLYCAHGLLSILIPVTMNLQGTPTIYIGLVQSCYAIGAAIGYTASPYFIKRSSHIRSFCAAAAIFSLSAISLNFYFNPFFWAILRLCIGFSISLAATSIESWLQDIATEKNRSQILGIYMVIYALAIATGQLLFSFNFGLNLFIMANMLAVMAVIPLSFSKITGPEYGKIKGMKFKELFGLSPLGLVGCFVYGLSYGAISSIGSIFALEIGLSLVHVSLFMFSVIGGGFLLQYPIGKLSDIYDRRMILAIVIIFSMCTNITVLNLLFFNPAFDADNLIYIIFSFAMIVGGSTSLIYPLCLAASFDWIKKEQIVSATKLCMLSGALGTILAPILSSIFIEQLGPMGLLIYFLLIEGSLLVYVMYRKVVRKSLPVEEQGNFILVPKGTSSSAGFLKHYAKTFVSKKPKPPAAPN